MSAVRVLVVDDQALFREALATLLGARPEVEVVGEAGNGHQALERAAALQPDVVLMDLHMPVLDGIAATRQIIAAGIETKVLVLTTFDLDEYVFEALRAGASGFLLKDMPGEDIVSAVRQAGRGADALLAPTLTRRLLDRFAGDPARPPSADLERLTARETDVLRLLACGMSNREIAAELYIEGTTVKTHVARILMKLDLRDRVQAVVVAYESGLVGPR
jgi:DNA-binding NarL/FixJ family response regulator